MGSLKKKTKSHQKKMNKVKLCEHPEYARYFKMLERGFPINNVKRIMLYDGKDPSILDQDPNDLEEVEDDDNDGDYCDIKRKRISAEQRRKRSDINRKNSNKRWHKDR